MIHVLLTGAITGVIIPEFLFRLDMDIMILIGILHIGMITTIGLITLTIIHRVIIPIIIQDIIIIRVTIIIRRNINIELIHTPQL